MTVLVCGSRHWTDRRAILRRLRQLPPGTLVIHGAARGADQLADGVAKQLRLPRQPYPAEWTKYGRAAGPLRNQQMIEAKPDLVLAFHPNLDQSTGTWDCVQRASRKGIRVELIVA